jgi:ParB/RepB/Spo0J family partition protein
MNESPVLIDLASLTPHPANPRLVEREDVIATIQQQIRASGFDPSHAILVRPLDGGYQIVSGHNRTAAARRAGLKKIPAWVREMDDDTAFMQLVLSNTQGELSPLERGIHALAATERHGDIKAYADAMGRKPSTVQGEVQAARVAKNARAFFPDLLNRTRHLAEIHGAPESCWPALIKRLLDGKWTVEQTNAAVKAVLAVKPPRGYEKLFALEKLQEMAAGGQDATEVTRLSIRAIERGRADIRDVQFAVEEHAAKFEGWLAESGVWDDRAITAAAQHLIDNQRALRRESEAKVAKLKRAVTLAEWKTLTAAEQEAACRVANPKAKLNKQDNDAIEWARWSWNPVTGCLHNCPYCYARDLAEKYYPQKFEPSIVPEALSAPVNAAPPKEAATDLGLKNIFTCSMADLFGNWVPKEWIEAVLGITRQAKQWNFLMLTKFPQRLAEFEFPDNVWTGTTVDCQARVAVAERAMRQVKSAVKWVSIEPMIEPITMDFSVVQWVVIGGARASAQTPAWRPPRRWVIDATHRAMQRGCAVYHKDNLNLERLRSYPGYDDKEPGAAPSPFHYLKESAKEGK